MRGKVKLRERAAPVGTDSLVCVCSVALGQAEDSPSSLKKKRARDAERELEPITQIDIQLPTAIDFSFMTALD